MFERAFPKSTPPVCTPRVFVRGVTLVELLVSVALLSVVLSLALPSYRDMIEKRQLTQGAEQVFAFLNSNQGIASRANSYVSVSFRITGENDWCAGSRLGEDDCDCQIAEREEGAWPEDACVIDDRLMVINNNIVGNKNLLQSINGSTSIAFGDANSWYTYDNVRGLIGQEDAAGNFVVLDSDPLEMVLHSPNDGYQLKLLVSNTGHSVLCSVDDNHDVPGYDLCPVEEEEEPDPGP